MSRARVLHLIRDLTIGGAQRSLMTLAKTPGFDSQIALFSEVTPQQIEQVDCIVAHVWRMERGNPHVSVPQIAGADPARTIIFNHDIEGCIDAPGALVLVYSESAAQRQQVELPVAVLAGGIAVDRFRSIAAARRWERVKSLGRLSTLHGGKIAPRTVDWWVDLPISRLVVGGQGPQMDPLQSTCRDARFEFPGEIAPRDRGDFFAQIDVFCYQTEWHEESFGYVVLEAQAAGCVVVTEARGALGELVVHEHSGLIAQGFDDAAKQITGLVADTARCSRISRCASRSAARYTSERMQDRFRELVAGVMPDVAKA